MKHRVHIMFIPAINSTVPLHANSASRYTCRQDRNKKHFVLYYLLVVVYISCQKWRMDKLRVSNSSSTCLHSFRRQFKEIYYTELCYAVFFRSGLTFDAQQ